MPLAEHDKGRRAIPPEQRVSIHVPLAEHDEETRRDHEGDRRFNSRAPRGARLFPRVVLHRVKGFNSRAPRGARPAQEHAARGALPFQFTCPSRSTTCSGARRTRRAAVSIHVPLAEHDSPLRLTSQRPDGFNSRAPRGARRFVIVFYS